MTLALSLASQYTLSLLVLLYLMIFVYGASHSSLLGFYVFVMAQEFWAMGLGFPFRLGGIGVVCENWNTTCTMIRSWRYIAYSC